MPTLMFPPFMTSKPVLSIGKTIIWSAALFAVMISTAIAIYGYILITHPVKVIELRRLPLPVLNEHREVEHGQALVYSIEYCKFVETVATMTRELAAKDGRDLIVMLPITAGSLPVGCHTFTMIDSVPTYVPPGKYTLRVTRMYRAATFFDNPVMFETEPFYVR